MPGLHTGCKRIFKESDVSFGLQRVTLGHNVCVSASAMKMASRIKNRIKTKLET